MSHIVTCLRLQHELFEAGHLHVADELLTPDSVDHGLPPGMPPGPEGVKHTVRWLHGAFSELRYDVEDTIVEGDRVVLRTTVYGVHTGDYLGRPPTGRSFAIEQIHIFRMADDGRVAEHWAVRDDLGLQRQLSQREAVTA